MKIKRKVMMVLCIFITLFVCIYLFFIKRDTYVINVIHLIENKQGVSEVHLQHKTIQIIEKYGLNKSILKSQSDKIFISLTYIEKYRLLHSEEFIKYRLSIKSFSNLIKNGAYVPIEGEEEFLK